MRCVCYIKYIYIYYIHHTSVPAPRSCGFQRCEWDCVKYIIYAIRNALSHSISRANNGSGLAPAEGELVPFLHDAGTPCGVLEAYPAVTWKWQINFRRYRRRRVVPEESLWFFIHHSIPYWKRIHQETYALTICFRDAYTISYIEGDPWL